MEPAKINWESLDSVFIVDQIYENINAPQWFDFLAPDYPSPSSIHGDEAWFCRPDCKHPKTAEDFLKSAPTSKLLRSASVSKLIGLGDWTRRVEYQKRQDRDQSNEEIENENPNSTPNHQIKTLKSKMKSSEEEDDDQCSELVVVLEDKSKMKLRSTQSAKDLFGGKDIFNKISEFCNEFKKMASWAKEKEIEEAENSGSGPGSSSRKKEKERKPFLEVGERSNCKKKPLRKKILNDDEAENIPVSLNLNIKDTKRKDEERCLLPIRTNPPTPQGFSATRDPIKTTPSKGPKSRLMERDILQEVGKQKKPIREEELNENIASSPVGGRGEGRGGLDVFWFLKPCTLSSS